jgi:ribose-phosphate pyrophosphokinase
VNALKNNGAGKIYGACTHAVFSGESLDRINKSPLTKLFVADTLPMTHTSPKIEIVSVSELFAESIWRTNKNKSISSLFDVDKGDGI